MREAIDREEVNLGLLNGLAGDILLDFLSCYQNGSLEIREAAELKLEELIENFNEVNSFSFENGLLGLGWLIEFCAQNKFISINSDEILEDLDCLIYKVAVERITASSFDSGHFMDLLTYFGIRSINKNQKSDFFVKMPLIKCLNVLFTRLAQETMIKGIQQIAVAKLAEMVLKTTFLIKNGVNDRSVLDILYNVVDEILSFFEKLIVNDDSEIDLTTYQKTLLLLTLAIEHNGNLFWKRRVGLLHDWFKDNVSDADVFIEYFRGMIMLISDNKASSVLDILLNIEKKDRSYFLLLISNYRAVF